jgi:hypothetical protein
MRHPLALSLALAAALSSGQALAANLFVNPGFEDPVTYDGPPFVGFWEAFQGGGATSANSAVMPRSGAQSLKLDINNATNTFAGAFQDVPVSAGQSLTFSGYAASLFDNGSSNELRFEWRNSVSNTEVSRTPNFAPALTSSYSPFELTAVVPAGVDTARIVYAIQSFGGPPAQTVFLDDVSATTIPEPTTALLAAAGLAAMIRRRR